MNPESKYQPDLLIPFEKVGARYGKVCRTIENYLTDETLGFPRPVYVRRRRYFKLSELESFEARFADRFGAKEEARAA